MPIESHRELNQILKKIPLFNGLFPPQIGKLLGLSVARSYQAGDRLCEAGAPSDELYILLAGELAVDMAEGLRVTALAPVTTVGEIGVITRQPRTATVTALRSCRVLVIPRVAFERLLRGDREMQTRVYQNIIEILAAKLVNDNLRARDCVREKARCEARLQVERCRSTAALELAMQNGAMTRTEAESCVLARMQELQEQGPAVDGRPGEATPDSQTGARVGPAAHPVATAR